MNAKKCKALRRQARELTVGKPKRQLMRNKETGLIINHPDTERGVYRELKKEARRASR